MATTSSGRRATRRVPAHTEAMSDNGKSDIPNEDPRDSAEPTDDPKHQKQDHETEGDVDDPDAPAPFSGPYS